MALISRRAILTEARDWIGTPYQHQASLKGAGCDCLGLVRGVWRARTRAPSCEVVTIQACLSVSSTSAIGRWRAARSIVAPVEEV